MTDLSAVMDDFVDKSKQAPDRFESADTSRFVTLGHSGIVGLYQGGAVPEGLKLYTFPESDWAMFSGRGPLPDSLQTLNTQVWKEWYPNEGQKYVGNGNAMLEVYSPGDMRSPDYECGIWVPICRPEEQEEYEAAETVSTMMVTGIL